VVQPKQKSTTPTMAPKKTKKEQAPHRKAALQKQLAAQRSKVMDPKLSLHDGDGNDDSTSGIEEAAEVSVQTTTNDKEESIQSNKDSKRKSPLPTSIQSYKHTKGPKKLVSSEKSNKQRTPVPNHEKKQKAARPDSDDSTGSEKGDSDEDYENRKRATTTSPTLKTNKQQNIVGGGTQSPAVLRAVLIETEEQLERAEQQVRAISKTRVADTFLEGQVCTWTKETLWKMCKFIINDQTMHKVMHKASKHFKVPASK
jgi:hypothetical protein